MSSPSPTPQLRDDRRAGSAAILLSTLLWGTLWIPLRQLDRGGIGGAWATTLGFMLPLLVLLPVGVCRRRRILALGRELIVAGFFLAAAIALYSEGLLRGYVARVILLFYLTPVWSVVLARVMLGEPIRAHRAAAVVLGLAGMAVVFGANGGMPLPRTAAEWMGLVSGVCWGLAMVYVRRVGSASEFDKVFAQFLFLGVLFFLFTLLPGGRPSVVPAAASLLGSVHWLLLFGVLWMPAVVWLTMFGGSRVDPGRVAILLMLEVVVGVVSAAMLTDEPFGTRELLGAILITSACGTEFFASKEQRSVAATRHPS